MAKPQADSPKILRLLRRSLAIFDICKIFPYKFVSDKGKYVVKTAQALVYLELKLALCLAFTTATILQTVEIRETLTVPQLIQCCFYTLFLSAGCYTLYDQITNAAGITSLLNGLALIKDQSDSGTVSNPIFNGNVLMYFKKILPQL